MKIIVIIMVVSVLTFVPANVFADQIPQWVKTNAEWWAADEINDDEFLAGIEFLDVK